MKKDIFFQLSQNAAERLAERFGTPLLVLSLEQIEKNYRFLKKHLPRVQLYYAIKANPHQRILELLRDLGSCFDVASDGEIRTLAAMEMCIRDSYVTKPFGMGELMARMRVCLRRAGNKEGEPILTCGGLQLNLLEHRVVVEGREVKLTPTEYELLKVMLKYAGRVLTHKQLLKAVWGNEYDTDTHYIRIYMRQLRRKIEPDPAQPKYLITEAGIGYRLLGGE